MNLQRRYRRRRNCTDGSAFFWRLWWGSSFLRFYPTQSQTRSSHDFATFPRGKSIGIIPNLHAIHQAHFRNRNCNSPPRLLQSPLRGDTPHFHFHFNCRISYFLQHIPPHAIHLAFSASFAIRHPCDEKPIPPTACTPTCAAGNLSPSLTIHRITNTSLPYIVPDPSCTTRLSNASPSG